MAQKQENQKLEIILYLNSLTQIIPLSWKTQTSLPFCPRSQKLPNEVPLPLFCLSNHQIEEESISGVSSYHSRCSPKLIVSSSKSGGHFQSKDFNSFEKKTRIKQFNLKRKNFKRASAQIDLSCLLVCSSRCLFAPQKKQFDFFQHKISAVAFLVPFSKKNC